jgi:hypothetical protein
MGVRRRSIATTVSAAALNRKREELERAEIGYQQSYADIDLHRRRIVKPQHVAAVAIAVAIASSTMWDALPAVAIVGLSISCAGIAIQSSIAAQPRYPRLELFWAPRSNA